MPTLVLIVDDEHDVCEVVAETLQRAGYATRIASDGRAALNHLRAVPAEVSVVLLDLVVPRVDGEGVLTQMAAEELVTPVIAMTASRSVVLPEGIRALRKPFDAVELIAAVRAACG